MPHFLILKLQGPMQAWGGHTFEDYRPSHIFPTRSALVGLLGACLGIDREDRDRQQSLSASFRFAVRQDAGKAMQKISDFHTVEHARRVDGKPGKYPIISRREYLCDACFSVALEVQTGAAFSIADLKKAVSRPRFTPFLGRRSCPLARPLLEDTLEAENLNDALRRTPPFQGTIYSEESGGSRSALNVRDVPMPSGARQFASRQVFIIPDEEVEHVSESMPS